VNSQVEDRVHRLTSRKDVSIYILSVTNTIAEQLLALYREKSAASAAAVDGRLFAGPDEEEVSLGQLLRNAREQFDAAAQTIDESLIEAAWPDLRERLRAAEAAFRRGDREGAGGVNGDSRAAVHPVTPGAAPTKRTRRTALRPAFLSSLSLPADEPAPIAPAPVKLPPPRGKLAIAIRNLPTHTFAVLHGTTDKARLDRVRAQFEAFAMTTTHTDYRRAWAEFNRLPMSRRERFTIANLNPESDTNPIKAMLTKLA